MFALVDSMRSHYEIPSTFDGDNPILAFDGPNAPARIKFGEHYMLPDADGNEIPARLYDAQVNEAERSMLGVYETMDGRHVMATTSLTESEVLAWKLHPDTFFGEVRPQTKTANNWLELCEFFHSTYKTTERSKLLDWMKEAKDIDQLKTLSQEELAITYCERMAWNAEAKR